MMFEQLSPLMDKLEDRVNFKTEYIGKFTKDGGLESMHGNSEITGDIVQLCAQAHAPTWRDFVECQAADYKNVDTNWRSCAASSGVDLRPLELCAAGDEGVRLLVASFDRSKAMGAKGSPTLFIGGRKYDKPRLQSAMVRTICEGIVDSPPTACTTLTPAPEVAVTLLEDARCTSCSTERVRKGIEGKIEKPTFRTLDYGTPEGKALHQSIGELRLPAAIFDATLDADPAAARLLGKALKQSGSRWYLEGGHNPVCFDDGGCKTASCKLTPTCRKEEPRVLELFMMSKCKFAAKGIGALAELLENFEKNKERVEVRLRLIGAGDAKTGLTAMHGAAEVEENLRHACAFKYYAAKNKFVRYLTCRALAQSSSDWAACTGRDTGIEAAVIEKCSTGEEGKRLLQASYELSAASGMTASPAWLASAKHKFSGVDAETLKKAFCEHNKLRGCETALSGMPAPSPRTVP